MFESITHAKQRAMLAAYSACGIVSRAAKMAGVSRETHYEWLAQQEYAAAFKLARELSSGAIEDEATRRAQFGVREPFVYRGQVVMHQDKPLMRRRYSDTILLAMLRSRVPEYRDKQEHEHSGKGGKPIPVAVTCKMNLGRLTDAELREAHRIALKARDSQLRPDNSGPGGSPANRTDPGADRSGDPETPATKD